MRHKVSRHLVRPIRTKTKTHTHTHTHTQEEEEAMRSPGRAHEVHHQLWCGFLRAHTWISLGHTQRLHALGVQRCTRSGAAACRSSGSTGRPCTSRAWSVAGADPCHAFAGRRPPAEGRPVVSHPRVFHVPLSHCLVDCYLLVAPRRCTCECAAASGVIIGRHAHVLHDAQHAGGGDGLTGSVARRYTTLPCTACR